MSLYVLVLVFLAFFLRLFSASQMDIGTDEMIYTVLPYNIISAERLSTVEQAPVYFYLVDLGYKLFGGISLVSGRLPSIIFGALAVILVFLITLQITENRRAALLSSFLYALSGYAIRHNQEMDMTAFFFSLLSIFFFLQFLKGKERHILVAALFLAIAVLVKPIVLLFVPAYALVWLIHGYHTKTGIFSKKEQKLHIHFRALQPIVLSLGISLLIVSPVFVYNFFLYKEKGITDYYFTVLAGVGNAKLYQGQEAEPWTFSRLWNFSQNFVKTLLRFDAMLFILGVLGLFLLARKQKEAILLFVLSLLFLVGYLAGKMGSATHFVWIPIVLSIFSGYGLVRLQEFLSKKFSFRYASLAILLVAVISLFFVLQDISGRKDTSIAITLRDYAAENIPDDAIVVIDPRIYRGVFAWAFPDKHYLEGTYFPEVTKMLSELPGRQQQLPLYYIECGPGTNCGWKPEDFQQIYNFGEQLSAFFRNNTQKVTTLQAIDTFIVYQGTITAPLSVYETIDRTHQFWYTPVGWKYPELAPDYYTPKTTFNKILNSFGFFILYLDVLLALLSPLLVFFLLGKQSG